MATPIVTTKKTGTAANAPSMEDLQAQIDALNAENARLKANPLAANMGKVTLKVSGQGALSIYGLNATWPTTMYLSQVKKLFNPESAAQILSYCEIHAAQFSNKGEDKIVVPDGMKLTPRSTTYVLGTDIGEYAKSAENLTPQLVPDTRTRKK